MSSGPSSSAGTPSTLLQVSQRLNSVTSLILERSRVVSLDLKPNASTDASIVRNLSFVKEGLVRIAEERRLERSGLVVGRPGSASGGPSGTGKRKPKQDSGALTEDSELNGLKLRYTKLIEMMEQDEIGRQKVKAADLRLQPEVDSAHAGNDRGGSENDPFRDPLELASPTQSEQSTSSAHPSVNLIPPTPLTEDAPALAFGSSSMPSRGNPASSYDKPYRDDSSDDDEEGPIMPVSVGRVSRDEMGRDEEERLRGREDRWDGVGDQQMLQSQRQMIDDQDSRLNILSDSIQRQHQLSHQIGDELDLHHDLLEETDEALDRTSARMGRARRNLDKVAKGAKNYGSTVIIVILILILLLLIIVLKT